MLVSCPMCGDSAVEKMLTAPRLNLGASAAEAITRIDRFVCDIKESQYGAGLHVFGQGIGEMPGLLTALSTGLHRGML